MCGFVLPGYGKHVLLGLVCLLHIIAANAPACLQRQWITSLVEYNLFSKETRGSRWSEARTMCWIFKCTHYN